jgi:hypothetical protein
LGDLSVALQAFGSSSLQPSLFVVSLRTAIGATRRTIDAVELGSSKEKKMDA